MAATVRNFNRTVAKLTLDPEGTHHSFVSGAHGRKIDMGLIDTGTPLYEGWMGMHTHRIRRRHGKYIGSVAVLGIANGTNRVARSLRDRLGVVPLYTCKTSPKTVELTSDSVKRLQEGGIRLVIAVEDVGTTGGTAMTGIQSALKIDSGLDVEAEIAWQRTEALPAFDQAGIPYHAIINEPLPTYTPQDCMNIGYCAAGWTLIPHGS